jgi:hypothetical protein
MAAICVAVSADRIDDTIGLLVARLIVNPGATCACECGKKRGTDKETLTLPNDRNSNPPVPKTGVFNRPFLTSEINIGKPITLRVAIRPLEVIHQTPCMVGA